MIFYSKLSIKKRAITLIIGDLFCQFTTPNKLLKTMNAREIPKFSSISPVKRRTIPRFGVLNPNKGLVVQHTIRTLANIVFYFNH